MCSTCHVDICKCFFSDVLEDLNPISDCSYVTCGTYEMKKFNQTVKVYPSENDYNVA